MASPIKKVCLVGANGTLGSVILAALVQANCFDVSILQRSTSSSSSSSASASASASIPRIIVGPDLAVDELTAALAGQDAVIAAFPLGQGDQHLRLAEACSRRPALHPRRLRKLRRRRPQATGTLVRERCEELAARPGSAFTWTALVCGHFFDHGLWDGLLHFDLATRTAQILDGGNVRASASTLRRIAEATVRVLQRAEQTSNRRIYVQSFNPTQLEVLAALEKAMGEKWHARHVDSRAYLEDARKRLDSDDEEAVLVAVEDVVFVLGALDADWTKREGFAMELLGLEDEKLEDVVAEVVAAYRAETS
ncbi:NAD(P)-binding protein [Trichoderma citrinoviride]|uniref:NAD(P)-binding protein n=1 Tax=Trichoderma citrinoviride TaxID=58853 RepID=A0A2T4B8W5_9HYPO|nr:NAD(P)-binding protein [Trichoderma citrinoviride]PTB65774.1 NAD(P)-binding protein [Trichoderma citrinoviride]